jgi:hypothetical protein
VYAIFEHPDIRLRNTKKEIGKLCALRSLLLLLCLFFADLGAIGVWKQVFETDASPPRV